MPLKLFYSILLCTPLLASAQPNCKLTDLDPAKFDKNFNEYMQSTALYCLQLSDLVYEDDSTIAKYYREMKGSYPGAGLQYQFIEDTETDTELMLWGTKDFMIISFRGTEGAKSVKDWRTNLRFRPSKRAKKGKPTYGIPTGHKGFTGALVGLIERKHLFDSIRSFIKRCDPNANQADFPIYTTGHSLGAGISQLLIPALKKQGLKFQGAYHFAPPLTYKQDAAAGIKKEYGGIVYNIVNYKDLVPRLRPKVLRSLCRAGKFYRICGDGMLYKEDDDFGSGFNRKEMKDWFSNVIDMHSTKTHITHLGNIANTFEGMNCRSQLHSPCLKK